MTNPLQQATELLWRHHREGSLLDALPAAWRPHTHAHGHAIQAQLPQVADDRVVGWKIAATSAAGQAHIQVSGPLAGRILSRFVVDGAAPVSLTGNQMRVCEPEFAFRMAHALAPRAAAYSVAEVLGAVATLHPAFELPDSRFADFASAGQAQLIADNACCGDFYFGPAAPVNWRALDLPAHAVHAVVSAAGASRYSRAGEGRAALRDPRIALTWLVNELSSLGITLGAGQFVSTGTCMVPLQIQPGDRVDADFGVLGRIAISLTD